MEEFPSQSKEKALGCLASWQPSKRGGRASPEPTIGLLFLHNSLLPNISTLAILISPRKSTPDRQNGGPQNEFPGIPRIRGFCGNSPQTLNFLTPISALWGPHFQRFGGEMKLICWALLMHNGWCQPLHRESRRTTFFTLSLHRTNVTVPGLLHEKMLPKYRGQQIGGKKTPKVLSALQTQVPEQAKKRFGAYQKKLVFKGKEGEKHIHQRVFQGCFRGPFRTALVYRCWPPSRSAQTFST